MGLKTFKGGVHPYEGKELAKDAPIVEVLPKGDLVYPLSQHIGAPASPIVAKGDRVLKGQKIAEAGGFVSSPIYASASGTVKAIEPRRVAVGDMVNSIVIENDGAFEEVSYTPCEDVTALSKEEIIGKVKEADILLCDEPTGALDYNTSKEILKLIETVNQKYNTTIIMVTHNEAIKDMADKVVKLRDGMVRKQIINEKKLSAEELDW